jgi:hypothetical protein
MQTIELKNNPWDIGADEVALERSERLAPRYAHYILLAGDEYIALEANLQFQRELV